MSSATTAEAILKKHSDNSVPEKSQNGFILGKNSKDLRARNDSKTDELSKEIKTSKVTDESLNRKVIEEIVDKSIDECKSDISSRETLTEGSDTMSKKYDLTPVSTDKRMLETSVSNNVNMLIEESLDQCETRTKSIENNDEILKSSDENVNNLAKINHPKDPPMDSGIEERVTTNETDSTVTSSESEAMAVTNNSSLKSDDTPELQTGTDPELNHRSDFNAHGTSDETVTKTDATILLTCTAPEKPLTETSNENIPDNTENVVSSTNVNLFKNSVKLPENSSNVNTCLEPLTEQMEISLNSTNEDRLVMNEKEESFKISDSEFDGGLEKCEKPLSKNDLKLKRISMSTSADESSCKSESDVTHEPKLKRRKSEEPSNSTKHKVKKDVHLKSYKNIEKPNSQEKSIDKNLKMKIKENNVDIKKKVAENSEILRDTIKKEGKSAAKSDIKDEERVLIDVNSTNEADVEDSKSTLPPFKVELNLKKEINGSDGDESLRKPSGGNVKCHLGTCDCEYKPMNLDTEKKIRTFFNGLNDGSLNVNMDVLEAIIGRVFVDRLCNKSEVGSKRLENLALKEEHERLRIAFNELKKQMEGCASIIKKMIQEQKGRGAFGTIPPRVTRSVGLQVCTIGRIYVEKKPKENKYEVPTHSNSTNPSAEINLATKSSMTVRVETRTKNGVTVVVNGQVNRKENEIVSPFSHTISSEDLRTKEKFSTSTAKHHPALLSTMATRANTSLSTAPTTIVTSKAAGANSKPSTAPTTIVTSKVAGANSKPSTAPTTIVTSNTAGATTKPSTVPPLIVVKSPEMMNTAQSNLKTAATGIARSAAEVIDLTANDPNPRIATQTNGRSAQSRSPGLASGNIAKNNSPVNRVVAFPADSTTYVPRPNGNTLPKTTTQSKPSSSSDVLLNTLSSLPSLPRAPIYGSHITKPPKPILRICKNSTGIMLSWNFDELLKVTIRKYQVFAYQEGAPVDPITQEHWKKVGDVDALPLPMACTLTQFKEGHKYFFVVRAMDVNMRLGEFSLPGSIMLTNSSPLTKSFSRV